MKPLMVVMGVRSSWAMLPMNCPRELSMVCSRAAMLLKVVAKSASSTQPSTGARAVKSPLPRRRAASLMSSIGPVMRLASTQHRMLHKIRMTAAEMPNIVSISVM